MSAYRVAIDQTTEIIDRRAKYFRNLIMAVVALSLGSMGLAVVTWTIALLAGLLLLVPVCGLFFVFDMRLLNAWRSHLLHMWVKKDLDFLNFCDAISAIQILPNNTLQSMLATLPSAGDLLTEQRISSSTRQVIATLVTTLYACRSDITGLRTAAFAIAGGLLMITVMLSIWQPLLGIAAITPFPLVQKRLRLWRLGRLRERTLAAQRQPDFDDKKCAELASCLPWEPISTSEKEAFLDRWSVRQHSTPVSS